MAGSLFENICCGGIHTVDHSWEAAEHDSAYGPDYVIEKGKVVQQGQFKDLAGQPGLVRQTRERAAGVKLKVSCQLA